MVCIMVVVLHGKFIFLIISAQIFLVCRFIEKLKQEIPGKGVKQQLEVLCNIYALFLLHKHQGDFLATGSITPKQGYLANDQLRSLYSQVCPYIYKPSNQLLSHDTCEYLHCIYTHIDTILYNMEIQRKKIGKRSETTIRKIDIKIRSPDSFLGMTSIPNLKTVNKFCFNHRLC